MLLQGANRGSFSSGEAREPQPYGLWQFLGSWLLLGAVVRFEFVSQHRPLVLFYLNSLP